MEFVKQIPLIQHQIFNKTEKFDLLLSACNDNISLIKLNLGLTI